MIYIRYGDLSLKHVGGLMFKDFIMYNFWCIRTTGNTRAPQKACNWLPEKLSDSEKKDCASWNH